MDIGVLKENVPTERRIALTPAGAQTLIAAGNTVYVEHDAGSYTHFSDDDYLNVGAQICYGAEEVLNRGEVVMKVSPPTMDEIGMMGSGQVLCSFLHLAIGQRKSVESLMEHKVTSIAYELIENTRGELTVLQVMSEIAGHSSIYVAAQFLQTREGGRGILMGSVPGIAPTSVAILGAGTVGRTAAKVALALGADVAVLDKDLSRLRDLHDMLPSGVNTLMATSYNILKTIRYADVVIGAVLLKGEKAPHLITEEMVRQMKMGSVIVDASIDQGGCVETSHPTTIEDPVFVRHGVVHYCVPNMTAAVPRTASVGLTNAMIPYLLSMGELGIETALQSDPGLAKGVCTYGGECTNQSVAKAYGMGSKGLAPLISSSIPVHRN